MTKLTLTECRKFIDAVIHKANEMGVPVSIAIVGPEGHLIALERMDDAGFINRKAGEPHRLQKAKLPIAGDVGISGAGDEQDGPVSRSDKVIGGVKRGLVVVNVHAWKLAEIVTYRLKPDHDRKRLGLVDLYQFLAEGEG